MPRVTANGLELEYETFGDPTDPPLLLIMGLGAQMTDWPDGVLRPAGRQRLPRDPVRQPGHRPVHLASTSWPGPTWPPCFGGDFATAPYLLGDFADDTAGLLDALGIARAHIVGASMGGMIAQQLTIDHPDRVAQLCSIMSTTGDRTVGQPTPEAAAALLRPPAADREERHRGRGRELAR